MPATWILRLKSNYTQVVVFALGPGSTLQHAEGLVKAFEVICRSCSEGQQSDEEISSSHHQHKQLLDRGIRCMQQEPQIAIRPREAAFSPTERYEASTGITSFKAWCTRSSFTLSENYEQSNHHQAGPVLCSDNKSGLS